MHIMRNAERVSAPAADSAESQDAARWRGARVAWLAAVAVAIVALFLLYWLQARPETVGSDGASVILQGSDMLHGNLLLHGWFTADVSFYSTEVVQYMLLQTVLAMSPGLVFVAGAMTYTILVVLAGWLAKGRATGREGILRVCVGVGVMIAPAFGSLLHAPDHLGSAVPVLLVWLVIDRCPRRWWVPAVVCVLLAWGVVADPLIEITGAAAIAVACGTRGCYQLLQRRRRSGDGPGAAPLWFELSLAVAAVVSVGLARLVIAAIHAAGGFTAHPVVAGFMGFAGIWQHAAITAKGLLALFGAAFWTETPGQHVPGWQMLFNYVHLVGVALVIVGFALALRRFFRADSLLAAGLAAGIVLNVAAFMTSRFATDLLSIREASAVLPFSAVLAGRLLPSHLLNGARLRKLRPVPVLAAIGVLYAAMLGVNSIVARPSTPYYQNVADWLSGHHLTNGLATGYWMANIVTVDAGDQVKVRVAKVVNGTVARSGPWEINTQWYDPSVSTANFLLTDAGAGSGEWKTQMRAAEATFGHPARTYRFDGFTVFTWRGNILTSLRPTPGT
ncbi:MAG TPA: hypothetical protein VF060_33720 [Trebonia sp.]